MSWRPRFLDGLLRTGEQRAIERALSDLPRPRMFRGVRTEREQAELERTIRSATSPHNQPSTAPAHVRASRWHHLGSIDPADVQRALDSNFRSVQSPQTEESIRQMAEQTARTTGRSVEQMTREIRAAIDAPIPEGTWPTGAEARRQLEEARRAMRASRRRTRAAQRSPNGPEQAGNYRPDWATPEDS